MPSWLQNICVWLQLQELTWISDASLSKISNHCPLLMAIAVPAAALLYATILR